MMSILAIGFREPAQQSSQKKVFKAFALKIVIFNNSYIVL
jgi:hypothetical protein